LRRLAGLAVLAFLFRPPAVNERQFAPAGRPGRSGVPFPPPAV